MTVKESESEKVPHTKKIGVVDESKDASKGETQTEVTPREGRRFTVLLIRCSLLYPAGLIG